MKGTYLVLGFVVFHSDMTLGLIGCKSINVPEIF